MWMPWVPGASCVTSTSMRTPPAAAAKVAVPIFWPLALTMSACADCAICTDDFCAAEVRADADGSPVIAAQSAAARIAGWVFTGGASLAGAGFFSHSYSCGWLGKATANVWMTRREGKILPQRCRAARERLEI